MFERFTDTARRVVYLAQEEARMLAHSYIDDEHILLGFMHEEVNCVARALSAQGVTLEGARQAVEVRIGLGSAMASEQQLPFIPHTEYLLERAQEEALRIGKRVVDTECLLFALLSYNERDSNGMKILSVLRVDLGDLRNETLRLSPFAKEC